MLLHNARILSRGGALADGDCLLTRGGRIAAIGSRAEVDDAARPGDTDESLDAHGAVVIPGLGDDHNHHFFAGRAALFDLAVSARRPIDDLIGAVAARVRESAGGSWIVGGQWGIDRLAELETVTARLRLDAVSDGHPVVLEDETGHCMWANGAALARLGITDVDTAASDRRDGVRYDAATGRPTGLLTEAARGLAAKVAARESALSGDQYDAAIRHAVGILNAYGITQFQDAATSRQQLESLCRLDAAGELHAHVVGSMPLNDPILGTDPVGLELARIGCDLRSELVRPDFVKVFLDGIPPSKTAAYHHEYVNDGSLPPGWRGETTFDGEGLYESLTACAALGLGAKVHCIGDRAVTIALDVFARLRGDGVTLPYHVAHGPLLTPADAKRLARDSIVLDCSPIIWCPGPIVETMSHVLVDDVADRFCLYRDLVDSGVVLAMGSDWPVSAEPNPWIGMEALVTRRDPTGQTPGTLNPGQALSAIEALACYTANSAVALGLSDETGSIEVGKYADFALVDRDPTRCEPTTIHDTKVLATFVKGARVHEAA